MSRASRAQVFALLALSDAQPKQVRFSGMDGLDADELLVEFASVEEMRRWLQQHIPDVADLIRVIPDRRPGEYELAYLNREGATVEPVWQGWRLSVRATWWHEEQVDSLDEATRGQLQQLVDGEVAR